MKTTNITHKVGRLSLAFYLACSAWATSTAAASTEAATSSLRYYTCRFTYGSADTTMTELTRKFNVTENQILRANNWVNPSPITQPGQKICIPRFNRREISLDFIGLNDDNSSVQPVGCGDRAYAHTYPIAPTNAPMTAAYKLLLSKHAQHEPPAGAYNALYQSRLTLRSASIYNGTAYVYLVGTLRLGGTCDAPRVQAQLENVALQFSNVKKANIFVNGKPLAQALSPK